MSFKFKKKKKVSVFPSAEKPKLSKGDAQEYLTGTVQDMPASAGEERMANALSKNGIQFRFRYSVGAPRNMPGWKELDFLIVKDGTVYAVEVDTAFTHRSKANSDVLHDAIIQNDKTINSMGNLWPTVIHADGESDLANSKNAESFVSRTFGK